MIEKYQEFLSTFGTRFYRGEKRRFITRLGEVFAAHQMKETTLYSKKWLRKSETVVYGNLKTAKIVFQIPYDTPSKILWYKNLYFPLHGDKTQKKSIFPLTMQILVIYFFALFALSIGSSFVSDEIGFYVSAIALIAIMAGVFKVAYQGLKNKKNYNRNGSGIIVALELLERMDETTRRQVAFAFTDCNVATYIGQKSIAQECKEMNRKPLYVTLNACGYGPNVEVGYSDGNRKAAQGFIKAFNGDSEVSAVKLTEDHVYLSTSMYFDKAISIAAGFKDKNDDLVLYNVNSGKDKELDEELLESQVHATLGLVKQYLK
ncbi:MAG: hypothetical protein ACRCZJ_09240 [Erysipelotrichaceae bacterium]